MDVVKRGGSPDGAKDVILNNNALPTVLAFSASSGACNCTNCRMHGIIHSHSIVAYDVTRPTPIHTYDIRWLAEF